MASLLALLGSWFSPVLLLVEQGGTVIWGLLLLALLLWLFMFERFISLYYLLPQQLPALFSYWQISENSKLEENRLWQREHLTRAFLQDVSASSQRYLSLIKTLISLCPLFGLLGTVSGMVQVFDVIAVTGSSDAKAMAGGIFKATLPTMSGLFLAVSALYFHYLLTQRAKAIQLRARELADEC